MGVELTVSFRWVESALLEENFAVVVFPARIDLILLV